MSRPRSVVVGLAVLVLLVAGAQLVPHGDDGGGQAIRPQARQQVDNLSTATAGLGRLTTADQAEIDQVLARGAATNQRLLASSPTQLRALVSGSAGAARPAGTLARTRADAKAASLKQALAGSFGGALVRATVRCAEFEGQRYCLGSGWTEQSEKQVRSRALAAARRTVSRARAATTTTGDLDAVAELSLRARLSPAARDRAEREELTQAARSVAKVWLLRHQIEGVALPAGFVERHPEVNATATVSRTSTDAEKAAKKKAKAKAAKKASIYTCARRQKAKGASTQQAFVRCRAAWKAAHAPTPTPTPSPTPSPTPTPTPTPTPVPVPVTPGATPTVPVPAVPPAPPAVVEKTYEQYPETGAILDKTQVAEQTRTYWCGPTAMQMIAWGSSGTDLGQDHWASRLGTTRSGTSISAMVRVVNSDTTWGSAAYAGPYVTLDITGYSYQQWMLLMMKHVVDFRSPVVLHPVLLKKYYPYLDDNASGHFQVGRGYQKKGTKADLLGYFEPWNQQRFDPSEPAISRVQWRQAYKSYRANEDHFQHNIGV